MTLEPGKQLLGGPLAVVHLGLDNLIDGARAAGAPVHVVDFVPPARGDRVLAAHLQRLLQPPLAAAIDAANRAALERVLASQPHLVGVGLARDVVPGMAEDLFLHAGPPITWERMSGPLKGAVIGGLILEGMAASPAEA